MNENINKKRTVKSFVKRNGRITKSQEFALKNHWSRYCIEIQTNKQLIAEDIFFNNNDIVLEIGFGNGQSLVNMAKNNPDLNYIGIEVYKSGVGGILHEIHDNNLDNLKIIYHDAVEVLENNIPDNFLSKVQLFFPDPWPKKRHHKRRIVQDNFVTLIAKKLKKGGVFHMATDWENYALHMLEILENSDLFVNIHGKGNFSPERPLYRPLTKFEAKGISLGHGVWDLEYLLKKAD